MTRSALPLSVLLIAAALLAACDTGDCAFEDQRTTPFGVTYTASFGSLAPGDTVTMVLVAGPGVALPALPEPVRREGAAGAVAVRVTGEAWAHGEPPPLRPAVRVEGRTAYLWFSTQDPPAGGFPVRQACSPQVTEYRAAAAEITVPPGVVTVFRTVQPASPAAQPASSRFS